MGILELKLKHWILLFAVATLLLPGMVSAETSNAPSGATVPNVHEVVTKIGNNIIRYPQLEGMADESIQQKINNAIVEKGKIAQRMVTLSALTDDGTGLTVGYDAYVNSAVFSAVISAVGIMENGRKGQEYTPLTFNLATGATLTLADLFSTPNDAVSYMEETLESTYLDELSSYLENSSLTPLPQDSFTLDADGITFYYPGKQFSLLSGYSGAAQFTYDELSDYLIPDATALPAQLGALPKSLTDDEAKAAIEKTVANGALPHVKVALRNSMTDLVSQYRLLRTPDQYPGGRYFQLEAPAFRQVLVLSDALGAGWESSKVQGIMSLRMNLYGIKTGHTTRDRWREILGEPESSVPFDEDLAFDYGLPIGTADYYAFGDRQLLLYAGEDDILYAIRLT